MTNGLYIFEDKEDFLKAIDELSELYNTQRNDFQYLHKHFNTIQDVKHEISFLNKCQIIAYSSFRRDSLIKVSLKDCFSNKFNITYSFNNSHKGTAFDELYSYLKKCLS